MRRTIAVVVLLAGAAWAQAERKPSYGDFGIFVGDKWVVVPLDYLSEGLCGERGVSECNINHEGHLACTSLPESETMDVPARLDVTEDDGLWWNVQGTGPNDVQVKGPQRRWECDDKRRVLLTSEDGNKHCILFPKKR